MAFSYNPLWIYLIEHNMTKEDLRKAIGASPATIAAMGKQQGISPKVLARICETFKLQPGQIMEYIPEGMKSAVTFDPPDHYQDNK